MNIWLIIAFTVFGIFSLYTGINLYLDSLETVEECEALLETEDDSYKKTVEEYWEFTFEC